ncbi:MAG: PhoH family protein [Lentisphaerae bacterium]|nr:PhoH family protein [Lentisphaerota bacterium]
MEQRFYFEPGLSFRTFGVKDEVRLIKQLANEYQLNITARDNWVELAGDDASVKAALHFFEELQKLFKFRQKELDRADFELVLRQCRATGIPALENLWKERIELASGRRPVMPRSSRQLEYLKAMRQYEVVFGIGPAGTGKTYLAMAMAVSMFLKGEVSRIILTRPARESGEKLGFLPGTLEDKVSPYLRPLYDALYEMMSVEEAQALISRNIIEVAPLAFMRGRTLSNAFIILDEAQNTTVEQMLMFLTRMGFGSRCVITGDPTQSDLNKNEPSGLNRALKSLRKLPELGFVFFDTSDVVRHALLEKIINAYNTTSESMEIRS